LDTFSNNMVTQVRSGSSVLEVVKDKLVVTIRLNKEYIVLTPGEIKSFLLGLQSLIENDK